MRRGAELVAAMHQRHAPRQRLQVQRPVERGIAAADDQQPLVAELLHLAHGIEHRRALVGLDAGDRRLLGLERAAAGGDHDHLASNTLPPSVVTRNSGSPMLLDALHHLAEMEGRLERLDLLHQAVGQPLPGDDRERRNVVDRLFRIELGALAAGLVEDVDQMGT